MKIVRQIVFSLNALLVLVTLLAYLSPFINPATFWPLSFLGLVVPFFLLLNLLFIFYWLITEWKRSWLSLVCLIVGANFILSTLSFSGKQSGSDENIFSLASYNMNYAHETYKPGTYRYDESRTNDFKEFILNSIDVDVLCAQESNKQIERLIGKYYPHKHLVKNAGTSIYSRYPMSQKGQIDFGTITNSCVWADVIIHHDTVRIYSAHLQSNKISSEAEKIVEEAENRKKLDMMNIRTIFSKYKRFVAIRSFQAEKIRKHMDQSPYPVILTGDLNDPPVSYTHRVLSKDKKDAFVEAGLGLGITYAGKIPLLRIDNVIVSDEISVFDHQIIKKRFSDHYPVKVVLSTK